MNQALLKKFAQGARRQLREQVAGRLEQVLRSDSVEVREKEAALKELRAEIAQFTKPVIIDRVAYTWFNRFCALRFMDVNHYTRMGVVSPAEGLSQPEILQEAKRGYIDDDLKGFVDSKGIFALLTGQRPAADPQGEAYRLLLVGACNSYNTAMPFLFEKIADYTELLMPFDLLSEHSVLHDLRQPLTPEACQDVEVIGWLYQYYISERKDEVFEALKQNHKIEAADIPAATQLFTPHWIVRYLVENSLGRLWMLNHPDSHLVEQMEYYIAPVIARRSAATTKQSPNEGVIASAAKQSPNDTEEDFLKISSPEEIKLNDPACGSGHMLTYAFDLLYFIYEESGYQAAEIPRLILEKNLYGIEIDPRAGALAAFALTMKARAKDRRFFSRGVKPNICVLENVSFTNQELDEYMTAVGRDLFTAPLLETLRQFEQADNFGSLIRPVLTDTAFVRGLLEARNISGNLFLYGVHERVLKVLKQAEFLAPHFHVVVANPPYMMRGNMNANLRQFTDDYYPDSQFDLFSIFIERNLNLVSQKGLVAMITMQSWMFLSSFEGFRKKLIQNDTLLTMAHLGARAFDTISGEVVSTTAFVIAHISAPNTNGVYFRVLDGSNETEKENNLRNSILSYSRSQPINSYSISAADLQKIPGSPIIYWLGEKIKSIYSISKLLGDLYIAKSGVMVGDDNKFLKKWFEVNFHEIGFGYFEEEAIKPNHVWLPMNKEEGFRKWSGRFVTVLRYINHGENFTEVEGLNYRLRDKKLYFKEGISWGDASFGFVSFKYQELGLVFAARAPMLFATQKSLVAFLNSKVARFLMEAINPTASFNLIDLYKLPIVTPDKNIDDQILPLVNNAILISEDDWTFQEISWNFTILPLLHPEHIVLRLAATYTDLLARWKNLTIEMKQLEESNNKIFIEAYNLQDELTPDVPLEEITLTCNPHYRYSGNRSDEELEALLLADTMKEFISFAVGCMFGRYSLEKPGLILANQGETIDDYRLKIADCGVAWEDTRFAPDEDNVIPVLEGEWFLDDAPTRFKQFLRITFGDEHYAENLAFIEEAIGRDIRSYFIKDFYKDHVQMYKKRPIYWMFSSPRGSFNVLIYMHRYQPDTISIILNDYLRQYREKLNAQLAYQEAIGRNPGASQSEKTKALREIDWVKKVLAELKEYEDEILYPLATQRIKIDLDDGVKVNYAKFGKALKPISGLSDT